MKRIAAAWWMLAMMVMLASCSGSDYAGEEAAMPQTPSDMVWSFDESTGELLLSGHGDMADYQNSGNARPPWGDVREDIRRITIQPGLESIGAYAFYNCDSLVSITLPDSITSIGNRAFDGCGRLAGITLPDGVTSVGDNAFSRCGSLPSVILPEGVTSIGRNTFSWCGSLASITIPSGVTSIGSYAFYECKSLTGITIPAGVTTIASGTFSDCDKLSSFTIPNSVTSIENDAFSGCDNLASIIIPNNVTAMGDSAFYSCDNLTSITIPDSVTTIGAMAFFYSDKLTIHCNPGSAAEAYAAEEGIAYDNGYITAYSEFLRGERLASPGVASWNPTCIYEVDSTFDTAKPFTYDLEGSSYALFDMNGDAIPELHVRSGMYYCIFTYYADELSVWYSGRDWYWPTDNGAILMNRLGAAPTRREYEYKVLDFWGNEALDIRFEEVTFHEEDMALFNIYGKEVYLFEGVEVTKEQWDALTEPYLSATSDLIEWAALGDDFTEISGEF